MMKIELNDGAFLSAPPSGSLKMSVEISFIMSLAIASATCAQMSTTLLYRSPCVTRPEVYCASISFTSRSDFSMITCFSAGTSMSSAAKLMPPRVARP